MTGSLLDRRTVLAGLAGLAAAHPALAADSASPVAHGILADNPLAQAFESAPSQLPDVLLTGLDGDHPISELLGGRTVLMPLWAEWCPPCLGEIPDFARLQQKYGNSKFAIVPVLTGARKQVTPQLCVTIFEYLHASVFEPRIEYHFGQRLLRGMASKGREAEIPCNLLIAPDGRVVGREFGLKERKDFDSLPDPSDTSEPELMARAEAGQSLSLWGRQPGDDFAAAMADGFLT